jgi:hypothetical protein
MMGRCVNAGRVGLAVSRACCGGCVCGGLLYVAAEVVGWAKRKVLGATRDETSVDRLDEDSKWGEVETEVGLEGAEVEAR